jgi:hypothetical protein
VASQRTGKGKVLLLVLENGIKRKIEVASIFLSLQRDGIGGYI